ncbi:MAG: carbon-nitrogen hydrolase family protein, partial [bacterium]
SNYNFPQKNPSRTFRVAVVQFARERLDPEKNLRRMPRLLKKVRGADLVCLPEAWVVAMAMDEKREKALLEEFCGIAAAGGFALITGGLFIVHGDRIADICHLIGADGKLMGTVKKVFPSFPIGERKYCAGGDKLPVFEVGGVKIGILICVDLFYPEFARSLARRGAEVIFNPSNIIEQRIGLWHSLAAARAAENTVYVVFSNNTKTEYRDERPVRGGSAVFAPWGEMLAGAGRAEKILYYDIDLGQIAETRRRWRYLEDIGEIGITKSGRVTRKKK